MGIFKLILMLLMSLSFSAHAEVFKCKLASGKVVYQSTPCPKAGATQDIVKIPEMDPQKAEDAKVRLEAWKQEQAVKETAEIEAEKQRKIELDRQESLELQRRSALAQEQQAIAAQQRQQDNSTVIMPGYYPPYWGNKPPPPLFPPDNVNNNKDSLYYRLYSPMLSSPPLSPNSAPEPHSPYQNRPGARSPGPQRRNH